MMSLKLLLLWWWLGCMGSHNPERLSYNYYKALLSILTLDFLLSFNIKTQFFKIFLRHNTIFFKRLFRIKIIRLFFIIHLKLFQPTYPNLNFFYFNFIRLFFYRVQLYNFIRFDFFSKICFFNF